MADPVAFAQARLDEDQAGAEACPEPYWSAGSPLPVRQREPDGWFLDGRVGERNSKILARGLRMHDPDGHCIAHAAMHDPARVLREVEAGRRIVARHAECYTAHGYCAWFATADLPCPDLADLLYRWAGHPDYDPEWAPPDGSHPVT